MIGPRADEESLLARTPPHPDVVVHVLTATPSGLGSALEARLKNVASVVWRPEIPPVQSLGRADIVLVDMDDVPASIKSRDLQSLLGKSEVCLVTGAQPVASEWLHFAHSELVEVVHCDAIERAAGFKRLLEPLLPRLTGPTGHEIAALVLEAEPAFSHAVLLVTAICTHPWSVRHPRELARAASVTSGYLKDTCRKLGFDRVEHFMVCVRFVALERLMGQRRLPLTVARWCVGIVDPSNWRRQVARVQIGSPGAVRRFRFASASSRHGSRILPKHQVHSGST